MRRREQIKLLNQQVQRLQHRLAELEQQHHMDLLKYSLLKCLAEGLQTFHVYQAVASLVVGTPNTLSEPLVDEQQLQRLMAAEAVLLQQLEGAGASSCSSSSGAPTDLGVGTISPAHDRMEHFKMLVQQTALCRDDMAGVTAERIALKMQQAYLNLGIQLSRLQAPLTAADAAAALKDIQDGTLQTLASLVMFHKADVVAKYQCYNLETMQSDPSFLEEATEHTLGVAPHMGLTQQQGHAISAGMDLYLGLMEGIQTEQVCLKLALSTIDPACSSAGLDNHAVQLEEQQQLYQRLQSLLRKEYTTQFAMCGWLVGSLSYEQLARATVLCWPFVLRVPHLGIGIKKWYQQQQLHQQ